MGQEPAKAGGAAAMAKGCVQSISYVHEQHLSTAGLLSLLHCILVHASAAEAVETAVRWCLPPCRTAAKTGTAMKNGTVSLFGAMKRGVSSLNAKQKDGYRYT